jgi:hypothetical protein
MTKPAIFLLLSVNFLVTESRGQTYHPILPEGSSPILVSQPEKVFIDN